MMMMTMMEGKGGGGGVLWMGRWRGCGGVTKRSAGRWGPQPPSDRSDIIIIVIIIPECEDIRWCWVGGGDECRGTGVLVETSRNR